MESSESYNQSNSFIFEKECEMKSDVNFEGEHRLNNKEESKNDIEVLQFQQSQINPDEEFERARKQLERIDKTLVNELMAYCNPPPILNTILTTAIICRFFKKHFSIIGAKSNTWRDVIKEIFCNKFFERLIKTTPDEISEKNYKKMLKHIVVSKKFKQKAHNTSKIAFAVVEWIYAVISFKESKHKVSEQKDITKNVIYELESYEASLN